MDYTGEIAAILTSVFFSFTAIIFAQASRLVGATITNRVRLVIALIYLMIINLILSGQPLPLDAGLERWGWLALSGVVGLALGDMFLFSSYALIGPRLGMLLMSLAPVIGALTAWLAFGETLRAGQIIGITVTLIGIGWVVVTRSTDSAPRPSGHGRGLVLGVLAATGQAWGLVLSKQGMTGNFSPLAGNAIRLLAATIAFWLITVMQRQAGETIRAVRAQPAALKLLALGALVGPVLGVSASLLAVQHAEVGVASTLMALPPVFLLPISYFVFKERFGWQTIAGTLVAMLGVGLLFLA